MSFRNCFVCAAAFLLFSVISSLGEEDHVLHYNVENFADSIKSNNHFVMFYAPWCGHCKRLKPVWEQLAEMLNSDEESNIRIAKVDCTTDYEVCSENEVTGYPTLKLFKLGSSEGVKFRGTRDLPSLTSFINEQLGSPNPEAAANIPSQLTDDNFATATATGNHFIKFYAPWCGHCQKLAPTWEELTKSYEDSSDIHIGKVDCTVHRTVCNNLEIKGYPTLLFLKDGSVAEKYSGQRTLSDLEGFVKKMVGGTPNSDDEPSLGAASIEGAVPLLSSETFQEGVSSGVTFVKFFAPWCGHCKRLAPTWSELSLKLQDTPNVRVVRVDCTQPNSRDLCNEQEVEGFPTLLLYQNGEKIAEYNGPRKVEDMYQFLLNHKQHDEL